MKQPALSHDPSITDLAPRAGLTATRHRGPALAEAAPGSSPPLWLGRVVELIRTDFDQPLTVQGLAREIGIHPIHLSRVFRRVHRISIRDYLRRVRIRFACRRIRRPDVRLADLAQTAGFADQSQFTRAFKEVMGVTPGRYRIWLRSLEGSEAHQRARSKSLSLESSSARARYLPSPETASPKSRAGRSSFQTVRSDPWGRSR